MVMDVVVSIKRSAFRLKSCVRILGDDSYELHLSIHFPLADRTGPYLVQGSADSEASPPATHLINLSTSILVCVRTKANSKIMHLVLSPRSHRRSIATTIYVP